MTPYKKLKSLANVTRFLKPGLTFEKLDALAMQMSDNETAAQLHKARQHSLNRSMNSRRTAQAPDAPAIPGGQYSFTLGGLGFTTFFQTHL